MRPPSTPPSPTLPPSGTRDVHEVAEDASTLLDLLVELGHLDDTMLSELGDRLLDLEAGTDVVSFQDVRRLAATIIFEHADKMDSEQLRVLRQEWPLLFW